MYKLGQYLNPETSRRQWGVVNIETCVRYFAEHYGKKAAQRLQMKLMAMDGYI